MSISIVSSLPALLPVNNPDVVIVSSNLTASANFRYICDVSGATASARLKCDKLPTTNYGFFGVNKVVETLIAPVVPQLTSGWQDGGYAVKANLTFREEYGSPPAVATATVTASLIAWQAGFRQQNYLAYDAINYYAENPTSDLINLKITSNRPVSATLNATASDFLGMVMNDANVTGVCLRITYDGGVSRPTFRVSGSVSGCASIINAGPGGLFNLTAAQCSDSQGGAAFFPAQNGTIVIQGTFNAAGNTAGSARTLSYHYTIDNCERYDQLRVFFRNMYGGVDGYTFTKKNRRSVNVNRQTYGYNNTVYGDDRYDKQWSVTYRDTYTLQSDWLTDLEFAWLQEMIYAPECWMQIGSALVPIIVQTNTYTVRTRNNDQLQTITVDVQIAYENTSL
jgi:hypothetical protein